MSWGDSVPNPFEEAKTRALDKASERILKLEAALRRQILWLEIAAKSKVGGAEIALKSAKAALEDRGMFT